MLVRVSALTLALVLFALSAFGHRGSGRVAPYNQDDVTIHQPKVNK